MVNKPRIFRTKIQHKVIPAKYVFQLSSTIFDYLLCTFMHGPQSTMTTKSQISLVLLDTKCYWTQKLPKQYYTTIASNNEFQKHNLQIRFPFQLQFSCSCMFQGRFHRSSPNFNPLVITHIILPGELFIQTYYTQGDFK